MAGEMSVESTKVNEMREKLTNTNTPINFLDLKHRKGGVRDITFIYQKQL